MNYYKLNRTHFADYIKEKITNTTELWIARALIAVYAIAATDLVIQIFNGQYFVINYLLLALSVAGVVIHCAAHKMIKNGKNHRAALCMIAANIFLAAAIQAIQSGSSLLTGASIGLVSAVIASQMLSDRWSALGVYLSFTCGALIAVFDYILPGAGGGLDITSRYFYLLLLIDALFMGFLLHRFSGFQMNVKLLLVMALLTISAVICTFTPLYLIFLNSEVSHNSGLLMNIGRVAVISAALLVIVNGAFSFLIVRYITRPLARMVNYIKEIGEKGDFTQSFDLHNQGEVSHLALALNAMNFQFKQFAEAAQKVSDGNLTVVVTPRSDDDILGKAFSKMSASLRQLVQIIMVNARELTSASSHLIEKVNNSEKIIDSISQAVKQVMHDGRQAGSGGASFEQLARAIDNIARGAQEQAHAVSKAAVCTAQIGRVVQQVSDNMQLVNKRALHTAENAQNGAQVIETLLQEIENIRMRVSQSAEKVSEMGERSKKIEEIVASISNIASQTNILALNTAIEAARSSAHTHAMAEKILDNTMIAQAWLIATILKNKAREMDAAPYWTQLAQQCQVDNIYVTDEDGVVVYTNELENIGFRFPDDPNSQTYVFRQLINKPGEQVCQPLQTRALDGKQYKYVGVSRIDVPGVVQVGFDGSSIEKYKSGGGVFTVISEEILELANQTQSATKYIKELNLNIRNTVTEAVASMGEGELGVESGVRQAGLAREALHTILEGTVAIRQQAEQAADSVTRVEEAARELTEAMDSVSAVVEQNTAATEEMAASTHEVSDAISLIVTLTQNLTGDMNQVNLAVQSMVANTEKTQDATVQFIL